jgi:hypothetical protein
MTLSVCDLCPELEDDTSAATGGHREQVVNFCPLRATLSA